MNPLYCFTSGIQLVRSMAYILTSGSDATSFVFFDPFFSFNDQCSHLNTPFVNAGAMLLFKSQITNYLQSDLNILTKTLWTTIFIIGIVDDLLKVSTSMMYAWLSHHDMYNLFKSMGRVINGFTLNRTVSSVIFKLIIATFAIGISSALEANDKRFILDRWVSNAFGPNYQYYVQPVFTNVGNMIVGSVEGISALDLRDPLFCLTSNFKLLSAFLSVRQMSGDYVDFQTSDIVFQVEEKCQIWNTALVNTGSVLLYKEPILNFMKTAAFPYRLGMYVFFGVETGVEVVRMLIGFFQDLPAHWSFYTLFKMGGRGLNIVTLVYFFMNITPLNA
eukprot:403339552